MKPDEFNKQLYTLELSFKQITTNIATMLYRAHGIQLVEGESHLEKEGHIGMSAYIEAGDDPELDLELFFSADRHKVKWSIITEEDDPQKPSKYLRLNTSDYVVAAFNIQLDELCNIIMNQIGNILASRQGGEKIMQEATIIEDINRSKYKLLQIDKVDTSASMYKQLIVHSSGKQYPVIVPVEGVNEFMKNCTSHDLQYVSSVNYGPFMNREVKH